jgi:hypothetical protein
MTQTYDLYSKPCARCGQEIPGENVWTRLNRGSENRNCADCNSGKRTQIKNGDQVCIPWMGEIDLDTMKPIDRNGLEHMPGVRTCGNNDCVNPDHVQRVAEELRIYKDRNALIAEQFSIYYRTKKHNNYDELIRAVKKEALAR